MRRPIIAALSPTVAGFISDSATIPSPSSCVPDLARDRIDHPPAAAIRLIYVVRPTWPVGCRDSAGLVKTVPSLARPSTDRATGCRCVAPSGRSAAAPWFFSRLHRPVSPLRRPFGP